MAQLTNRDEKQNFLAKEKQRIIQYQRMQNSIMGAVRQNELQIVKNDESLIPMYYKNEEKNPVACDIKHEDPDLSALEIVWPLFN